MREKIEIIFDKHDGKLVRLEDYKELEEENKEIRNRIIEKLEVIIKLKKELGISEFNLKCYIKDLKERIEKQKKLEVLMLKTINIFEVALELKEVKSK